MLLCAAVVVLTNPAGSNCWGDPAFSISLYSDLVNPIYLHSSVEMSALRPIVMSSSEVNFALTVGVGDLLEGEISSPLKPYGL